MEAVTITPRWLHGFAWCAAVGSVLLWVPVVVTAYTTPSTSPGAQVGVLVFSILAASAGALFFWRVTQIRATFGVDTIEIVGPVRTTTIPRSEFLCLEVTSRSTWVFLVMRSNRRVAVLAIGGAKWRIRQRVAEVNRRLQVPPP